VNATRIASILRQAGAIAAVVVGAVANPAVTNLLPASVSAALIGVGGVLIAVEHAFNGNAGNPPSTVVAVQPAKVVVPTPVAPAATPETPLPVSVPAPTATTATAAPVVPPPAT
jgi:hypothetical protein